MSCCRKKAPAVFDIDAEDGSEGADYLAITIEPRVELKIEAEINAEHVSRFKVTGPPETLQKLQEAGLDVEGAGISSVLSPSAVVDVPEAFRADAGIPTKDPPHHGEGNGHGPGVSYCYIHPLANQADRNKLQACDLSRNSWAFVLLVGGYAYFNQEKKLIWVNAIQFVPNDDTTGLLLVGHKVSDGRHAFEAMKQHQRMVDVQDGQLLKAGFRSFGWVHSNEKFPCETREKPVSEKYPYPNGSFLYSRSETGDPGTETFHLYALMTPRSPDLPGPGVGEGSWYHACVARARSSIIKLDEEDEDLSRTTSGSLECTTTAGLLEGSLSNAYAVQIRRAMVAAEDRKEAGNLGSLRTVAHDDAGSANSDLFSWDNLKANVFHALYLAGYIGGGILFYTSARHQLGSGSSDDEKVWSLTESFYFAVVTMSTVGYGDLSPELPGAKVFTAVYIMLGVGMVFGHAGALYDSMVSLISFVFSKVKLKDAAEAVVAEAEAVAKYVQKDHAEEGGVDLSTASGRLEYEPDDDLPWWQKRRTVAFFFHKLFTNLVVGVVFNIFFSAWVFTRTEPEMSYWAEAVWHCFVTSTTVGYGDVSLTTEASQRWASVQILISVSWLASMGKAISAASTERGYILTRAKALKELLSPTLIDRLGGTRSQADLMKVIRRPGHHPRTQVRDQGTLSELEFVVGMLEVQGAQLYGDSLTWDDHTVPLLKLFHRLDQDDSGSLDNIDLKHMREQAYKQSASAKNVMEKTFNLLNQAITHAKEAEFDHLLKLLYPEGTDKHCSLTSDLINTVPMGHSGQPRLYGLLHQLAFWGDNADNGLQDGPKNQSLSKTGADVYEELKEHGIEFDLGLRTRNGKGQTAYDVATEHKQFNFARKLEQDQYEADQKRKLALTKEIQSRKEEIEQLERILLREQKVQARSQEELRKLQALTPPNLLPMGLKGAPKSRIAHEQPVAIDLQSTESLVDEFVQREGTRLSP